MKLGAVDVGGTFLKCAVFDAGLSELENWKTALPESLEKLVAQIGDEFGRRGIAALGLAVAGFVDPEKRLVYSSPNISYLENAALGEMIADAAQTPVFMLNDANAAALGYYNLHGEGESPLICLTIGTGLGSGIVIDGKLFQGAGGLAPELGHFRIVPDGRLCGCGSRGCAETEISATALLRNYFELSQISAADVEDLVRLFLAGDSHARAGFGRFALFLGHFIASLIFAFNPRRILLSGGVSRAAQHFLPSVMAVIEERVPGCFLKNFSLHAERSEKETGLTGAAYYARSHLK